MSFCDILVYDNILVGVNKNFRLNYYAYVYYGNPNNYLLDENINPIEWEVLPDQFLSYTDVNPTNGVGITPNEFYTYVHNTPPNFETTVLPRITITPQIARFLAYNATQFKKQVRNWTLVKIVISTDDFNPNENVAADENSDDEPTAPQYSATENDIGVISCEIISTDRCMELPIPETLNIGEKIWIPAFFLHCIKNTVAQVNNCIDYHKNVELGLSRRRATECLNSETCSINDKNNCISLMAGENPECMWCEHINQCLAYDRDSYIRYCEIAPCNTLNENGCNQNEYCKWDTTSNKCLPSELRCSAYISADGCNTLGSNCSWDSDKRRCLETTARKKASCSKLTMGECLMDDLCKWDPTFRDATGACLDKPKPKEEDPLTLYCGKWGCWHNKDDTSCNMAGTDINSLVKCPSNYYESHDRDHHSVCHVRQCTRCDDSTSNDLYCGQRSCTRDLNSDDLSGQDNCTGSNQNNLVECPCGYVHQEFINATGGTVFDCDIRHCVKSSPFTADTIYCGKSSCSDNSDDVSCNWLGYSDSYLLECPAGYTEHGQDSNWVGCSKRICKKNK